MNALIGFIQIVSAATILICVLTLCLIVLWLFAGGGVIGCGKGIFDDPNWLFQLILIPGLPLGLLIGSIKVLLWSSEKIT